MERYLPSSAGVDDDILRALESFDTVDTELEKALAYIAGDDLDADMKRFAAYEQACKGRAVPPRFSGSLMDSFDRVNSLRLELPPSQAPVISPLVSQGYANHIISKSYDERGLTAAQSAVSVLKIALF